MAKIKIEDLGKIAEGAKRKMTLREGAGRVKITVHMGTCGISAGARNILNIFLTEIDAHKIKDAIVTTTGCAGLCSHEPMITVELTGQAPVKYVDLNEQKTKKIFNDHVLNGKMVNEYAYAVGSERIL
jgi:NADP-reducing hydrogenase subunit HndB